MLNLQAQFKVENKKCLKFVFVGQCHKQTKITRTAREHAKAILYVELSQFMNICCFKCITVHEYMRFQIYYISWICCFKCITVHEYAVSTDLTIHEYAFSNVLQFMNMLFQLYYSSWVCCFNCITVHEYAVSTTLQFMNMLFQMYYSSWICCFKCITVH